MERHESLSEWIRFWTIELESDRASVPTLTCWISLWVHQALVRYHQRLSCNNPLMWAQPWSVGLCRSDKAVRWGLASVLNMIVYLTHRVLALTGGAQLVGASLSVHLKITGSILGQASYGRQPMDVSLSIRCFSLSL